jgi:FtsP/CotA-like multicopper oxidase with cupredoxin domain
MRKTRFMSAGWLAVALGLLVLLLVVAAPAIAAPPAPGPALLDPKTIPKYVNQLDGPPPIYEPVSENGYDYYEVDATEFTEQILPPGMPQTTVWGYGGQAKDAVTGDSLGYVRNSPGPSFMIERNTTVRVKWINELTNPHLFPVDPTLHWANPNDAPMMDMVPLPWPAFPPGFETAQTNVPMVVHVHGAEVHSTSDGFPDAWWTAQGDHGMAYNSVVPTDANAAVFEYGNTQQPATIWYHDHALGVTRTNVMSGLAGFYFIRDENDPVEPTLPQGQYDMPIVIQDRTFYANGSFWFPTVGLDPAVHPYWNPEFFGDTIMVNGKIWPNMNVTQGTYRFHLLDGSNARFYRLSFSNKLPFTQIGSDGGYLKTAATMKELTIAPGERTDILVDFSALPVGTTVVLQNTAKAPFPAGTTADPQTTGQIMQFTVTGAGGPTFPALPPTLNPTLAGAAFPDLPAPTVTRVLTLQEVMGALGPTEILLDGQKWMNPVSELPQEGTTEEWVIVNPTMDTHPIHLHLVQFQLVSRQAFQVKKYQTAWMAAQGGMMPPLMNPTVPVDPTPYLQGKPSGPLPGETGWKDTIQMNPGEVTRIRVRFTAQDGSAYPFDPTTGPGYVWHCHILDHEDNEMMRPYQVTP